MNALTAPSVDHARRLDIIAGMASLLGVKVSTERQIGYVSALEDVPCDLLAQAVGRAIQSWRFPDMPKPGDLRASADELQREAHEAAQQRTKAAERQAAAAPFRVFGRMPKTAVAHRFGGFIADVPCDCVACYDAQVQGPPRFVPDGTDPPPICERCQDTGTIEVRESNDVALLGVARCVCVGHNPQLVPTTRYQPIEMGRWLHGAELREHELAQERFQNALRAVVARARMPKTETR